MNQGMILWDRPMLERFKTAYAVAQKNNLKDFEFEGKFYDTRYAMYLIEYLNSRFGIKND